MWIFSTAKCLNKIKCFQKRALRFWYDDHTMPYEGLLEKAGKVKMSADWTEKNNKFAREKYKLNLETAAYF